MSEERIDCWSGPDHAYELLDASEYLIRWYCPWCGETFQENRSLGV